MELTLRRHQKQIERSIKRFSVIVCHRRFGKTLYVCDRLVRTISRSEKDNARGMYYCPTKIMAKQVAWDYLCQLSEGMGEKVNHVELRIDYPNGGRISLGSADNPDRSRGIYLDIVAVDEPAHMPMRLWSEVLRPTLIDRKGTAIFLGTPAGRHGMLWSLFDGAETDPDWSRFEFKASKTKIIPAKELDAARATMSKAEYDQEFECSFSARIKGAYFGREMESAEYQDRITALTYDPDKPVHIAMDTGVRGDNVCWFFQINGESYNFLECKEFPRASMSDIVGEWQRLPYKVLGRVIVPHPPARKGAGTVQNLTRAATLRNLGVDVLEPPVSLAAGDCIDKARHLINRSRFDADQCKHGLECLRQYTPGWDDKHQTWRKTPLDNWATDSADAFRFIAVVQGLSDQWGEEPDYSVIDAARRWG